MIRTCSRDAHPAWDGVDWSPCYRENIFGSLLPIILLSAAVAYFAFIVTKRSLAGSGKGSIRLMDDEHPSGRLTSTSSNPIGEADERPTKRPISLSAIEDEILLTIVREGVIDSLARSQGQLTQPKITIERIGDWVGLVGAVALFGTCAVGIGLDVWDSQGGGWQRLALLGWMTCLAMLNLVASTHGRLEEITPTSHLPTMMLLFLPIQFFLFRSALIHRSHSPSSYPSPASQKYTPKDLFLTETILFVIHLTWTLVYCNIGYRTPLDGILRGLKAGKGSRAGTEEGAGEGELGDSYVVVDDPAEPKSIFSRALFSHVLPLLFRHYSRPLTVKDIPALREDDIPAVSLAAWRMDERSRDERAERKIAIANEKMGKKKGGGADVKRQKTALFLRLLWHFRTAFAYQIFFSLWACALSFFPPLGLQLLLKFVATRNSDDPVTDGKTPVHVAILYVIGMAFGQVASGVCYSQVLNTGRRICIRMRGIVIAEVFTKALRRRDLAGQVAATVSTSAAVKSESDNTGSKDKSERATKPEEKVETNVTNLVGVDAFFLAEIAAYLYYFISCPVTIVVAIALLYNLIGVSAWAGVAVMIALTPAQALIGKLFARNQKKLLSATDARLEAATEMLGAIKTIKFAAWEGKFFTRMQVSRDKELDILRGRFLIRAFANVLVQLTPPFVTVVTFAFYTVVLGNPLTASTAFTSLALFGMLRSPLGALLEMTTATANAYVSANRIQDFLDTPETLRYEQLSQSSSAEEPVIGFRDADVAYISKTDAKAADKALASEVEHQPYFKLAGLNLDFPVGKLSLITGKVSSGKTTILSALLGENYLLDGRIFMPSDSGSKDFCEATPGTGLIDTVAYCPQTAWLMGTTIRSNILFGSKWDNARYKRVLHACALERDLEIFQLGDQTICGSKGAVMSGGQKARIALARAMYSSSRILLLDDVLSAVDTQTATHIFHHCLTGPLMSERTCILVTHAVGLTLPGAAYAVVLDAGNVLAAGPPQDLQSQGFFEEELLADDARKVSTHLHIENGTAIIPHVADGTMTVENVEGDEADREEVLKQAAKDKVAPAIVKDKSGFFKAEKQEAGQVDFKVYQLYFKALGKVWYWMGIIVLFFGSQSLQVETNNWLKDWANSTERTAELWKWANRFYIAQTTSAMGSEHDDAVFYLTVYIVLNFMYGVMIALRTIWLFNGSLRASRDLYRRLLVRVLGAKMRFFDSTPAGQILNRLSNDIQTIDQQTAETLMLFTQATLASVAVLVVICIATPVFVFTAILICALFGGIGVLYVAFSREVKRSDSTTKSPVLVSFGEALTGMISIRAYADSARFTKDCLRNLEINIRAFHLMWQANRVLSIYCEIAGSLVTVFAALFVLVNRDLSAATAGLSLSYAQTFVDYVLWIVRLWAANEQNMNSTERIGEYLQLESEEDEQNPSPEPPAHWPSKYAKIEVDNLVCAYAPGLPAVLRGISFTVNPGERIGVCGRTGSGKSSLMLALFRFIEISSGSIRIDGIDTSNIKISELRKRLTILPQEAQLFSGSVRENLDPFGEHEDVELWEVLRQVGLSQRSTPAASRVASRAVSRVASRAPSLKAADDDESEETETELMEKITIKSLDEMVAKGAENYSHGARQLFALARGMLKLRHSSILVMDESTANLDHQTDASVQRVIQEELGNITMLIVAHRLRSVATCDKILVLDHGKVLEYASPWELLQREGSSFRELCEKSGEESVLRKMAEDSHILRMEKEQMRSA